MSKPGQTITNYFEADHDRLDSLFYQFSQKKSEGMPVAKPYFREFLKGLRRHIVWEEDVLFPFIEKEAGMAMGPTTVMKQEHRAIGAILDRLHEKVRAGDIKTEGEEQELRAALKPHNDKEENILYPALDQYAGKEHTANLFLKMGEIPEERFKVCCGSHE